MAPAPSIPACLSAGACPPTSPSKTPTARLRLPVWCLAPATAAAPAPAPTAAAPTNEPPPPPPPLPVLTRRLESEPAVISASSACSCCIAARARDTCGPHRHSVGHSTLDPKRAPRQPSVNDARSCEPDVASGGLIKIPMPPPCAPNDPPPSHLGVHRLHLGVQAVTVTQHDLGCRARAAAVSVAARAHGGRGRLPGSCTRLRGDAGSLGAACGAQGGANQAPWSPLSPGSQGPQDLAVDLPRSTLRGLNAPQQSCAAQQPACQPPRSLGAAPLPTTP